MFKWLFKAFESETNKQYILRFISKQKEVKFIGDKKDQQLFLVGKWSYNSYANFRYYKFHFSKNNEECIVKIQDDKDIFMVFSDPNEVEHIKNAILFRIK